jgi:hypothetical protein
MIINLAKINVGRSGDFSLIIHGREVPVRGVPPTPTEELRVSKSILWAEPTDYFNIITNLNWQIISNE